MPPRTSYTLTPAGVALQDVIDAIDRWGRSHLPSPSHDKPRRTPRLSA
jgi:DNA-binding HxlR family transcriptional regulator